MRLGRSCRPRHRPVNRVRSGSSRRCGRLQMLLRRWRNHHVGRQDGIPASENAVRNPLTRSDVAGTQASREINAAAVNPAPMQYSATSLPADMLSYPDVAGGLAAAGVAPVDKNERRRAYAHRCEHRTLDRGKQHDRRARWACISRRYSSCNSGLSWVSQRTMTRPASRCAVSADAATAAIVGFARFAASTATSLLVLCLRSRPAAGGPIVERCDRVAYALHGPGRRLVGHAVHDARTVAIDTPASVATSLIELAWTARFAMALDVFLPDGKVGFRKRFLRFPLKSRTGSPAFQKPLGGTDGILRAFIAAPSRPSSPSCRRRTSS